MSEIVTIHGFRVYPYGRMTAGFRRALRELSAKGFGDPSCVVVKTRPGTDSGITHWGGRFVHPDNPFAGEVIRLMRAQGMDPLAPPFVVVPGATTLYHEWGHHVDRCWSKSDQEIRFSFRWFSAFYRIRPGVPRPWPRDLAHLAKPAPTALAPELDAAEAAVTWYRVSSELFANLFEDWMRGKGRVSWDHCHPEWLGERNLGGSATTGSVEIDLLPGVTAEEVRARTYDMFARGLEGPVVLPPVRDRFLGPSTATTLRQVRRALRALAAECSRSCLEGDDQEEQAEQDAQEK